MSYMNQKMYKWLRERSSWAVEYYFSDVLKALPEESSSGHRECGVSHGALQQSGLCTPCCRWRAPPSSWFALVCSRPIKIFPTCLYRSFSTQQRNKRREGFCQHLFIFIYIYPSFNPVRVTMDLESGLGSDAVSSFSHWSITLMCSPVPWFTLITPLSLLHHCSSSLLRSLACLFFPTEYWVFFEYGLSCFDIIETLKYHNSSRMYRNKTYTLASRSE